jgi:hypothetical protein
MSELAARLLFDDGDFAVRVDATGDAAQWAARNREPLEALAARHPVVLVRGLEIGDAAAFARIRDVLIDAPADYVYRSTPRTEVASGIMTATEYPAGEEILQHSENAYQRRWPMRLVFCCLVAPGSGGQTPVADLRRVTTRIGAAETDAVAKRRIRYVRNYHPGVDLDWRTVFQTGDPAAVTAFCAANGITAEWSADGRLRTAQTCQGAAEHPDTGERVWFNQAHLFHASALGDEVMQDMLDIFGADGLPRDARYGDGTPIDPALLDHVRQAFAAEARAFDWQAGDVMIVDNMRASHGRRPFGGDRTVLVSMGRIHGADPAQA